MAFMVSASIGAGGGSLRLPKRYTKRATVDVVASVATTGNIPEPKIPTAVEANAPIPICKIPSIAEALPAFFVKGISANVVPFGIAVPTPPRR